MLTQQTLIYLVYALAAAAAVLLAEALYLQFIAGRRQRAINRRLRNQLHEERPQEALKLLLKERGLTGTGDYLLGLIWLNRLYAQSGITGNPVNYFAVFALGGLAAGIGVLLVLRSMPGGMLVFLIITFLLPILVLRRARARRIRAMERQIPDALDMIVRSLRAGHPTSVAIGLVAREMPDPIGTEFGMVFDEITFGARLESAVRKMAERVGFEGLQLLAVALGIQARTGGNLAEILANLGKTLRERHVLRLKVRALSSEGKVSAIMLSAFPLVMFGILAVIAPGYYGEIWGDPLVIPIMAGFGAWALFGDFIMYRMVNFDF